MAPRKPKGIDLPSPGDVVNWMRGVHDTAMVASGDRAPVSPGDTGVRNLGRGISMLNQGMNPYARTTEMALGYAVDKPGSGTQLIKSMATDAAITATAAGATYGAIKAAGKVAESGILARAYNAATGQKVLLSGRQTSGYSHIIPHGGKYANDPELAKHAYSWFDNPQAPNFRAPKINKIGSEALPFAHDGGTLYAVRGKASSFTSQSLKPVDWGVDTVVRSQVPQKVVGSIPIQHAGLTSYQTEIMSMLKRAGYKPPRIVKK